MEELAVLYEEGKNTVEITFLSPRGKVKMLVENDGLMDEEEFRDIKRFLRTMIAIMREIVRETRGEG